MIQRWRRGGGFGGSASPNSPLHSAPFPLRGKESPDAISLCYANTSLPDLLGRPSLNFIDQVSAMQWTSLHHTEQLFLNLSFYGVMKNVNIFFWRSGLRILILDLFIDCHD